MKSRKWDDPVWIIFAIYIASILMILVAGCNPVKKVLNDPKKLQQVAKVLVLNGFCANDTTIITKSDTLVHTDTITDVESELWVRNDTVYKTQYKNRIVKKTLTIRDTIQKVVVDNARVNALQAENQKISIELDNVKQQSKDRLHWAVLLLLIIIGYIVLKFYRK